MKIQIKRVYEPSRSTDGKRIPADRLWPRGLTKDSAKVDVWAKYIAPSTELRKWYGHDPYNWQEFKSRYLSKLRKTLKVSIRYWVIKMRGRLPFYTALRKSI